MTTTNDDKRRALMLDMGRFLINQRGEFDDGTQTIADGLTARALALSFPDGAVDLRWDEAEATNGYRDHSVALAQVDAALRGDVPTGEPYPDGANPTYVVDQATHIMAGLTAVASASGLHASSGCTSGR